MLSVKIIPLSDLERSADLGGVGQLGEVALLDDHPPHGHPIPRVEGVPLSEDRCGRHRGVLRLRCSREIGGRGSRITSQGTWKNKHEVYIFT